MTAVVSRYRFREWADGFAVEGDGRPPVMVTFHPFELEAWFSDDSCAGARERFGLFNFGRLLEFVARGLMREWRASEGWYGATAWAHQQTAKAIARRLREQWLRLLAKADPTVQSVQKAIFAATFGEAPLARSAKLYEDRFLVQDIINFPAAAIAVRYARTLTRDRALSRLHRSAPARELQGLAKERGLSLFVQATAPEPDEAAQLDALKDWKSLFSDTGEAYGSLNRTLMNLPGRVPYRLVCQLRNLHLDRPLQHRLELLAVVLYANVKANREEGLSLRADHSRIFQHARASQVRAAMERVAQHLQQPLDTRKTSDVRQMVQLLADCPEPHAGNLSGLADRAIRWHRERQAENLAAMKRHYGAETAVALPPAPLPDFPEVTFLGSVGAICAEAEKMQHCVASYIDLAVQGNCFLFHVSYKGEEATIEVGCEGRVRQAQGPRNQRNKAATRGKRLLSKWSAQFPPGPFEGTARPDWRRQGDDDIPF